MTFCQKCGKRLTEDSRFCPKCGHPVEAAKRFSDRKYPLEDVYEDHSVKERPGFLSFWLGFMIFSIAFSFILVLATPVISPWVAIPSLILNSVCVWALYNWKRWGFYGIVTLNIIGLLLNGGLYGGLGLMISIFSTAISILILYVAMSPVWDYFE